MTKEEYENRIAELQTQIDELKKAKVEEDLLTPPHPRWMPRENEIYYCLFGGGTSYAWKWHGNIDDGARYSIGNVFHARAEAEFAAERLKVLAEMREWAGHGYNGAYIYYHRPSDEIMIDWNGNSTYWFGDIRFKCVDDAENCIKAVGKDRIKKYYFMVSEDEADDDRRA